MSVMITFLWVMQIALLGRVLSSWIDRSQSNPISQALFQLTEPIVAPIRAILPSMGMLDFSPLVAMFMLMFLRIMLAGAVA
jgi:YggT family protein